MILENNSKLLFIGDSITDCGRTRPVGILPNGLGDGYVNIVNNLIHSNNPACGIKIINMGKNGDTIRHLKARWQQDLIEQHPDWVCIMIGVNDVWRKFDRCLSPEMCVELDEYKEIYIELIENIIGKVKGIILMTPFFLETNKNDAFRSDLDRYGAVVKELAEKYNTIFVDTQAVFDDFLENIYSMSIAADRVHPNQIGHTVIAKAILNSIEF